MKYLILLLLTGALIAQEKPQASSAQAPVAAMDEQGRSVMIIDPKARAADFAQAFDFLRKDKPTLKIMVRTLDARILNVTDVTASAGGTLLMIKILSSQGVKTQILPVEQIMEINYSP